MLTVFIIVATAIVFYAIGLSWTQIAIAVPLILILARGSTLAQSWVERRTGRKTDPNSESYTLSYYGITLGIALPSLYLFPDSHPLAFGFIVLLASTLGTVVSIAMFGVQSTGSEEA